MRVTLGQTRIFLFIAASIGVIKLSSIVRDSYRTTRRKKNKVISKDKASPPQNGCPTWLKKKSKWCSHPVAKGEKHCNYHTPQVSLVQSDRSLASSSSTKFCIKCETPIMAKKWSKHQLVCPAILHTKQQESQAWFVKDISAGTNLPKVIIESYGNGRSFSKNDIKDLIRRVELALNAFPAIEKMCDSPPMNKNPTERKKIKHETQHQAIISVLSKLELLNDKVCILEMGAGKAELSRAIREHTASSVVAVDMQKFRFKADIRMKQDGGAESITRIFANIKDLALERVSGLHSKPVVSVSKHLCGCGLDFALRCLTRALKPHVFNPAAAFGEGLSGVVMATCCHHRCVLQHYCNLEMLTRLGFTPDEFRMLCTMSSWAVCGESREKKSNIDGNDNHTSGTDGNDKSHLSCSPELTAEEKRLAGWRCKRLLDYGRVEFLQQQGYKAWMIEYVSSKITPENVIIIAVPVEDEGHEMNH